MLKLLPESFFDPSEPGVLRILSVKEWRDIGITQSMGWEHYEVHAPEPHILLFRREKDYLEKVSLAVHIKTGESWMQQHNIYTEEEGEEHEAETRIGRERLGGD